MEVGHKCNTGWLEWATPPDAARLRHVLKDLCFFRKSESVATAHEYPQLRWAVDRPVGRQCERRVMLSNDEPVL